MECDKQLRELDTFINPPPYEHIMRVRAQLLHEARCDHCNKLLTEGCPAVAMTIWHEHRGQPYRPWEHDYLALTDVAEAYIRRSIE